MTTAYCPRSDCAEPYSHIHLVTYPSGEVIDRSQRWSGDTTPSIDDIDHAFDVVFNLNGDVHTDEYADKLDNLAARWLSARRFVVLSRPLWLGRLLARYREARQR